MTLSFEYFSTVFHDNDFEVCKILFPWYYFWFNLFVLNHNNVNHNNFSWLFFSGVYWSEWRHTLVSLFSWYFLFICLYSSKLISDSFLPVEPVDKQYYYTSESDPHSYDATEAVVKKAQENVWGCSGIWTLDLWIWFECSSKFTCKVLEKKLI